MALSKEQIKDLKNQLLEQIKNIPADQREEAKKQIENLSDSAIESILENQKESQPQIFREIISGKIPSKKVEENDKAIAVLDIKPISKGHTIIIPKEPLKNLDKIPNDLSILVDKVSKTLLEKLDAKNIKVTPELKFDEVIINLIPIYDKDLTLESKRLNPSPEEINKTLDLIKKEKEKIQEIKEVKEEIKELKKFPRRIP